MLSKVISLVPLSEGAAMKITQILFLLLIGCAAWLGVFQLPFHVPVGEATLSNSYAAGFNNRVATLAASLCALAVFGVTWLFRPAGQPDTKSINRGMPGWLLAAGIAVTAAFYALLTWTVAGYSRPYGEARYFLDRTTQIALYGRMPYRDFSFSYGPLLLYPQVGLWKLLAPFGATLDGCYFAVLMIQACIGIALLFFILDQAFSQRRLKISLFLLMGGWSLNPTMGMNYTYFRFLIPIATFLYLGRIPSRWKRNLLIAVAAVVSTSISPEQGVAFSIGASVFCGVAAWNARDWRLALDGAFAWLALPILLAIFGKSYLLNFWAFSGGHYNFVLVPAPHIILYLIAFVFIVPLGLARDFRTRDPGLATKMALWAAGSALIAAAFGRCDPGHVYWNGFGVFLLSFLILRSYSKRLQGYWIAAVFVVFLVGNFSVFYFYKWDLIRAAYGATVRDLPTKVSQTLFSFIDRHSHAGGAAVVLQDIKPVGAELDVLSGNSVIATPFEIDNVTKSALIRANRFQPNYFVELNTISNQQAEDKHIQLMEQHKWVLIPQELNLPAEGPEFESRVMFYPVRYAIRHKPFVPGAAILDRLKHEWEPRAQIGSYALYRRK
jgi:hypothetical protein